MNSRQTFLVTECLALTFAVLATGCHREEPVAPTKNTPSKGSVAHPAAQPEPEAGDTGNHRAYLSNGKSQIGDPASLWATLESFRDGYSQLSNEQFIEATQELLRLRSAVGEQRKFDSLVVASKIEDIVSYEVARRVANNTLSVKEANQLLPSQLAPVFDLSQLTNLIGYSPQDKARGNATLLTTEQLKEFAVKQAGGEDGLFNDFPAQAKDTWALDSKKAIFKLSVISAARRRVAALQAYLVFRQRGGDLTRQPLYKHIQEVIPDILNQPVVICAGLQDDVLLAGDIERLVDP